MGIVDLGLRGVQFLFTLITLSISAALAKQTTSGGSPSQINFAVFVSAFSMLCLVYFIFSGISGSGHGLVLTVLDGLNLLFTFAAGVALAAKLHVHSCGNFVYTHSNSITNGAPNTAKRCHESQALTAFLWFLFATYIVTVAFSARQAKNSGGVSRGRGGIPSMSQV